VGKCFGGSGEFNPKIAGEFAETLMVGDHELLITEHCLERVSIQRYEEGFARYNHIRIILDDETPALCFADEAGEFAAWTSRVEQVVSAKPADYVRIDYWEKRKGEILNEDEQAELERVKQIKAALEANRELDEIDDFDTALADLLR
jgi:hypothetical protein